MTNTEQLRATPNTSYFLMMARGLLAKWERTGFLAGLQSDHPTHDFNKYPPGSCFYMDWDYDR